MKLLHIHNGDSSANILKQSGVAGEHFPWREALIAGPAPAGVAAEKWRELRASHLVEFYGADESECQQEFLVQEEQLAGFSAYDEVTLWFEHDLFCLTNLLYLMNWFAGRDLGTTRLSLVWVGEFPAIENFRGLGQLTPLQMASLFEKRQEVSALELSLAQAAWEAFCSPDPRTIEALLQSDTSALPFLKDGFHCHLERFPSLRNGLGRIEKTALELIDKGINQFPDLFSAFGDASPMYGLGDAQFWVALRGMRVARQPLLELNDGMEFKRELTAEQIYYSAFAITPVGKEALTGGADAVDLNGIDQWLGGVHLSEENLWRWDETNGRINAPGVRHDDA